MVTLLLMVDLDFTAPTAGESLNSTNRHPETGQKSTIPHPATPPRTQSPNAEQKTAITGSPASSSSSSPQQKAEADAKARAPDQAATRYCWQSFEDNYALARDAHR